MAKPGLLFGALIFDVIFMQLAGFGVLETWQCATIIFVDAEYTILSNVVPW